mgnify:FL=1
MKILNWKYHGIISDDWNKTYERVMNCEKCEYCNTTFKNSKNRQLDHNHSILDKHNIRGVLCKNCNIKDVLK